MPGVGLPFCQKWKATNGSPILHSYHRLDVFAGTTEVTDLTTCGQRKNNTEEIESSDDMSVSFWKLSRDISYAQNFTEFFDQIEKHSEYAEIPEKDQLSPLEDVEGVWYTLWNELLSQFPAEATIKYSAFTQAIDYLTIWYTLCGESWITISTNDWVETLKNTADKDGNYTCDGQMRQESFYVDKAYGVTISLMANTSRTPCFAMVDRLETATEIDITTPTTRPTRTPRPSPTTPNTATPTTTTTTTVITETTTVAGSDSTATMDFSTDADSTPTDPWSEITIPTNATTTTPSIGNATVTTTTPAGGNTGGSAVLTFENLQVLLVFIVPYLTSVYFEQS